MRDEKDKEEWQRRRRLAVAKDDVDGGVWRQPE